MRLILTTMASAALLLAAPGLISDALAHGGAYRGPAGEVPPDSREPFDPPPPPETGGPTTPPGEAGGPTTGDGGVGTPSTGEGGTGTPSSGTGGTGPSSPDGSAGGPKTGPGRPGGASKGPGYEDWTFWWNFNKDELLQLKSKTRRVATATGTSIHVLGRGRSQGRVKTATDAAIAEDIVPALRKLLEQKDILYDIQSATALALAKIGDKSIIPVLKRMARNDKKAGSDYHREVEETAALALGILQDDSDEVREFLIELMSDKSKKGSFVRPFAAVSLGLLGKNSANFQVSFEALLAIVADQESSVDIKPAALLAIGLLQDDRAVPDLLHMLMNGRVDAKRSDRLSDVELAFVVEALGRIGTPGSGDDETAVFDAVADMLAGKGTPTAAKNLRRSAVITLGQIAPHGDSKLQGRAIALLKSAAKSAKDASERTFALVALGRIAAADVLGDKAHRDVVRTLQHHLDRGRPANLVQPYAALSLALAGSELPANEESVRKPLREKFTAARGDPRARAAYAISLGIVEDVQAVPGLIDVVTDRGLDKRLRGYGAIALGLIGGDDAREAVRAVLTDDNDRTLRKQTAIAAGLMGDARVITDLVAILESGDESQYIMGSVALALGQIGDEKAVGPLLAIAVDAESKYPDLTRAFATVALGQIGDRRDLPVLARVGRDINFRVSGAVPALTELLSIL